MGRREERFAKALGAKIVATLPDTGGGAFGAARMAEIFKHRLTPGLGQRPGRPTDSQWKLRRKIPMKTDTAKKLKNIARRLSTSTRKVSPMQVAALLLERAVANEMK